MTEIQRSEFTLHAETLQGDLMKLVLDEMKAMPDVWARMSEDKQEDVIMRVGNRVAEAVRQTVQILAGRGKTAIKASIDSVTVKKNMKAVLIADRFCEHRHLLIDAAGATALIVIADASEFLDGGHDIKPDKNQKSMDV